MYQQITYLTVRNNVFNFEKGKAQLEKMQLEEKLKVDKKLKQKKENNV